MKSKSWLASLACLWLLVYPSQMLSQSFTLDDILSAPYTSDLTAAANVDRLAWVANERGVRNIWTAAAPQFKAQKLTGYDADDGQTIGSLRLTPVGKILVYVRGGSANRAGEHTNPMSDPDGAEQAIWAIGTDGGHPWKIAVGSGPVLSPSGETLLFSRGGQLYEVAVQADTADNSVRGGAKQLFKARGRNGGARWAADGKRVAFVSARGDHSFIGIYDRDQRKITWMAPCVDRDSEPVWSPDGKRVAYIRSPGLKKHELRNITGGHPFAIWVAHAASGEAKKIWRSPADDGGFAQYYPAEPMRWVSGDRLLFHSEHDGWMHLYSISAKGGPLTDLTPGHSEVEHSAVSAASLFYSTNHGDIDRRHIWRALSTGGAAKQLTSGTGLETDPVALASGRFVAYRGATTHHPPAIMLHAMQGGAVRQIFPEKWPDSFPQKAQVAPQQVVFKASDGLPIHGQLFLPKDARSRDQRPAVIFMHGGPIRQMLLGWHYRGYYANAYAMNQYLANQGYVVLSVNFRSGIGYGRAFRRAENQGPRGASEYRDIIAAGRYLQQRPEVDPARVGLWGGSYGGYLTAMGLARDSDLFRAGVDLHGVHDWAFRGTDFFLGGGWGLQGDELLDLAYKSSPVADLTYWSSPVLFVHGDDDRNVLFQQTTDLVQRLRERNVHVETLIFPDEVHGFLRHESWLRTFRATANFFDRFLKNGRYNLTN
ncbi:prolyl oligopeptidase family serine peptidase [bacterium]|nr:prolyl oligopeptidase family serine peptidase [bacterium]